MGLLGAGYRTYETQQAHAGVMQAGEKEPLTPVAHLIQNAQIEITISSDGDFVDARPVAKEECKTIIPVTTESANRTSGSAPHPLCDQLCYLAPYSTEKYAQYLAQLTQWADSPFTHPKVQAVLAYESKGTILSDLVIKGMISGIRADGSPEVGRIEGMDYGKCLVRWRIIPAQEGVSTATWQDQTLFRAFADFYDSRQTGESDWCMISGQRTLLCETHNKGVVSMNFGAKLISANDSSGFTYRGRFLNAAQAESVGYDASQKAHNALRWTVANYGVLMGGRSFVCWNPEGAPVPMNCLLGNLPTESGDRKVTDYQSQLRETINGCRKTLPPDAEVVVAALDAATTGRLSVTYYNELRGSDFLDRIEYWYTTCLCDTQNAGLRSPSLRLMANCAFGTQQAQYIQADDRVLKEHVQQLMHCILDKQPVPQDIVRALTVRAGMPLAYSAGNREILLSTACAVIRKSRNDRSRRSGQKEEWTLALDTSNQNRSYLFGRLLAIAEQAERSTYGMGEERPTNASRMQTVFTQRPMYAWAQLEKKLKPYLDHMNPGLRNYYKNMIGEIVDRLSPQDPDLDKKLEDVYLLGYYHQRAAMTKKKETTVTEEK